MYSPLANVALQEVGDFKDRYLMPIMLHYSYQEYVVDGENYMRVKFYLKGSKRKGTVHVDVKQVQ